MLWPVPHPMSATRIPSVSCRQVPAVEDARHQLLVEQAPGHPVHDFGELGPEVLVRDAATLAEARRACRRRGRPAASWPWRTARGSAIPRPVRHTACSQGADVRGPGVVLDDRRGHHRAEPLAHVALAVARRGRRAPRWSPSRWRAPRTGRSGGTGRSSTSRHSRCKFSTAAQTTAQPVSRPTRTLPRRPPPDRCDPKGRSAGARPASGASCISRGVVWVVLPTPARVCGDGALRRVPSPALPVRRSSRRSIVDPWSVFGRR